MNTPIPAGWGWRPTKPPHAPRFRRGVNLQIMAALRANRAVMALPDATLVADVMQTFGVRKSTAYSVLREARRAG